MSTHDALNPNAHYKMGVEESKCNDCLGVFIFERVKIKIKYGFSPLFMFRGLGSKSW